MAGIPTGGYSFFSYDGGPLDPNRTDPGRFIVFQTTENYAATYSWNFGDGTPAASGPNVTHSFAAPGSYTVVLTETLGASTFPTALPTTFVVSYSPKWVVSGLAYAAGVLPGSFYVSDVVIQNPSLTQTMSLSLTLADGTAPASVDVAPHPALADGEPQLLEHPPELLRKERGRTSHGAHRQGRRPPGECHAGDLGLDVQQQRRRPDEGDLRGRDPGRSSLGGRLVRLVRGSHGVSGARDVPDFSSRSPLVSYPDVSPAYTNVGFVNPGDASATLTVDFYSSDIATLFRQLGTEVTLTLNPNETRQITKALTSPVPTGAAWDIVGYPEDNYFMTVSVAGGGTVVPYTSLKDIGSSDSVFMTNDGSIATSYRVPAVVRANGQNGTVFRSRLVLFNPSGSTRTVQLSFSYLKCVPGTSTCDPRKSSRGTSPSSPGRR